MIERIARRLGLLGQVLTLVVLTVAVALSGSLATFRQVLLVRLDERIDNRLEQEAEELRRLAAGLNPVTGTPFAGDADSVLRVFFERNVPSDGEGFLAVSRGQVLHVTPAARPVLQDGALLARWSGLDSSERDRVRIDGRRFDYLAVPLVTDADGREAVFVVVEDYDSERAKIDEALLVELVVSGLALLAASAVAGVAAGRLLAPLRLLTAAAQQVTERNLGRRLPVPTGTDEVATLTRTFNAMLDRLDEAFEVQRDFLADAGHEIRTPITIVRGHLELMGDDPQERADTVELVTDELDRMARLVSDLLLLARARRPDFLQLAELPPDVLLEEVLEKARVLGQRQWLYDGSTDVLLCADRHRLTQAVLQLVQNAVQHGRPVGVIAVGSAASRDGVHVWVRDDGPGIPVDDQARVFQRFSRVGARRSDGAGLGLAIVCAIAEAHGGSVDLFSRPGKGATFVLTLPRAVADSTAAAGTRSLPVEPPGATSASGDSAPPTTPRRASPRR